MLSQITSQNGEVEHVVEFDLGCFQAVSQHVMFWHPSDFLRGANGTNHTDSELIHNGYKFCFKTEEKT